tara:strand:- start:183 stop:416 length:234 start_codon:yes stop_codon:yes gene_type:complete
VIRAGFAGAPGACGDPTLRPSLTVAVPLLVRGIPGVVVFNDGPLVDTLDDETKLGIRGVLSRMDGITFFISFSFSLV